MRMLCSKLSSSSGSRCGSTMSNLKQPSQCTSRHKAIPHCLLLGYMQLLVDSHDQELCRTSDSKYLTCSQKSNTGESISKSKTNYRLFNTTMSTIANGLDTSPK